MPRLDCRWIEIDHGDDPSQGMLQSSGNTARAGLEVKGCPAQRYVVGQKRDLGNWTIGLLSWFGQKGYSGRWLTKTWKARQSEMPRLCLAARGFAVHGLPSTNERSCHANQRHSFPLSSPITSPHCRRPEDGMRCQPRNEKDTIIILLPSSTCSSTIRHEQLLQFWSSGPNAATATATISETLRQPSR